MNKRPFLILSLFLLLFSFDGQAADTYRPEISVAGFIPLPDCGRQVYNFNPGWRFFKGDIRGRKAVNFDDRSWEVVSTPHTVELMPAEGSGCRNYQGPAWYRKHFVVPTATKGQRVLLHFEAAMGKQVTLPERQTCPGTSWRLSAFHTGLDGKRRTSRRLLPPCRLYRQQQR